MICTSGTPVFRRHCFCGFHSVAGRETENVHDQLIVIHVGDVKKPRQVVTAIEVLAVG